MSVYIEISGEIHFRNKMDAKRAFAFLKNGDWLRGEGEYGDTSEWVSDGEIVGNGPIATNTTFILFNGGVMRNLGRVVNHILDTYAVDKEKTHYRCLCTDGMFALSEYSAEEGTDVDVTGDEFFEITGCREDEIDYDTEDISEGDEGWIDSVNDCLYNTVYENACDWVVEG